ncbi:MAG: hypothetical protein UT56_C0001G0044 [Candidatus Levybacteria bacterium GW2011_GWB1_39_7]|nr:MAG: hypothetical protein UT20_C0001G0022 [Candidatus Levybacteria bacterium GW2011_GWA1_39_11]KKR25313.1 MAG: hypothetical protein UT56_C0001G0044 [Candidatus Levybacteria bacterium GW2011_GWB1_39_7]KKR27586.1 MAG: hypothetical protein UT57_C0001G0010 [Microgenomates group bacterium GW2011_GWC1_39_7]KKR50440.1 MAG: hypothetical protein UT85_C0002G0048 [Candidatus Levybacteria bacterium GW2011_GWA2_40_16]OGH14472.1 MAG: hypothetical protein A2689_00395 [Candidatus Levybacteria bacterium RIFC
MKHQLSPLVDSHSRLNRCQLSVVSCKLSSDGFTLIELVLVVAIMGILSAFFLTVLNPFEQFKKAADSQRKSDLAQVQRALEVYYEDYSRYPEASSDKIAPQGSVKNWGSSWAPYINLLPKDSSTQKLYIYMVSPDGQSYWLYASLDRQGKDPQACNQDGSACSNVPAGLVCGASASQICNYGISSPNVSP